MENAPTPVVSICVPTIGRLDFLSAVKSSIAAQTFDAYEVLVLDNGSPEEVRADLDAWVAADARVRVLRSDERIPMWDNFNRGVLGARGKYVAFCHDDDELYPEFLATNVAFMEDHPAVGFVGSNHDDIDVEGKLIARRERIQRTEAMPGVAFIEGLMRTGRTALAMQTIFFRRAVFPEGGFDPTISRFFGDFILLMRMAESWHVGTLAEVLVKIRLHDGQASQRPLSEAIPIRTRLFLAYLDELRAKGSTLPIDDFERRVRKLHVLHLGFGWLEAKGANEAAVCAREIGALRGVELGPALHLVERIGPFRKARAKLAEVVRKVALRA